MIGRARLRLTLWYAAIFVTTLIALGTVAYWSLARSLNNEVDQGVETVVDIWLGTAPDLSALQPVDLEREFEGETADVFLLVFRSDGTLVANPNGVEAEEFVEEGLVASALRGSVTWATLHEDDDRFRVLAVPIIEAGRIDGAVIGGRSLATHDRQLALLLTVLGAVGAGGLVMAVVGGYVVSGRALRPVAAAYERQRAFVGDASHELRSPLAVIRASAELMLRERLPAEQRDSVQEIVDTSVEASDLVEDLLALARLDRQTGRGGTGTADAQKAVADLVHQMAGVFEAHDSAVTTTGPVLKLRCDARELRRALRALLENVLAHTPPGTAVEIETRVDGDYGLVVVRDHGSGVPPAAIDTLFEPFTRVDSVRTPESGHSGLGLAIAHRLVVQQGGTLTARNHPGGGLEMTIRCRQATGPNTAEQTARQAS
jgi:signal transduction histidine kinase